MFGAFANNLNYFVKYFNNKNNDESDQQIKNMLEKMMQYKHQAETQYNITFTHIGYCALVKAFLKANQPLKSIQLLKEALEIKKIKPNVAMFNILANVILRMLTQECICHNYKSNNNIKENIKSEKATMQIF